MVLSIVLSGVAIGCIYALIGIAYNVMFSASRVFSFTAGTLGMVGGILGSLFILRMGMPIWAGFILALAGGAVLGIVTEILAVRPVLKSLDQHLYVLSTLALALMVQQFAAIEWSTEPQPFPRIFDIERGIPGLHHRPVGTPRRACRRVRRAPRMTEMSEAQSGTARASLFGSHAIGAALPFLVLLIIGLALPLFAGGYWGVIATRACVYWVLVAGLNLLVGFAGQLAIGWVAILTLGAYTTSVLAAGNVLPPVHPYLALAVAGVFGAIF